MTSSKLKVGLKTLENGVRDILDKLLQLNHAKILSFLQNEEYLNIGIADLMTMIFNNYNAKQKCISIDKDWVKDNFEMKKKYDEEFKSKSEKKP